MNDHDPSRLAYEKHGRTVHLSLQNLDDLNQILLMDEVHWLATTAPVSDFLLPNAFLSRLDTNGDGRIRVEELKRAIRWFRDSCSAREPGQTLTGAELKSEPLQSSWSKLKRIFEVPEDSALSLPQLHEMKTRYKEDPAEWGSGSLLPEQLKEPSQVELLTAVQERMKPAEEAVTEEQFTSFLEQAQALVDWRNASPGENHWAEQYPSFKALENKIEEYFFLADTESYAGEPKQTEWFLGAPTGKLEETLRPLPLVRPLRPGVLDFSFSPNPAHGKQIESFRNTFLDADESTLSRPLFEELKARFETYSDWLEASPITNLSDLDTEQLKAWLNDSPLRQSCLNALREKRESGLVLKDFDQLEGVLLMKEHLLDFCRNFVAFPDLYNPDARALFERGTLIMDGRKFNLSLPVDDLEAHKKAADRSNMFVLYVEVEGQTLAVPVTSGDKGFLAAQKRGVFQHVDGTEKEARVIDLVSNPISFWEALVAPFQKITDSLKERLEKISADRETALVEGATEPKAEPKAQLLAGGGVAVAALGSSLAFVVKTLAGLTMGRVLFGLLVLFLAFLAPAALIAAIKLRNRDLSAVLEGNTWGINARMMLTAAQARQFTQEPHHPGGVRSRLPWVVGALLLVAALVYYYSGSLFQG